MSQKVKGLAILITVGVGYGIFRRLPRSIIWKEGTITGKTHLDRPCDYYFWEYDVEFADGTKETICQSEEFAEIGDGVEVPYCKYPGIISTPWL